VQVFPGRPGPASLPGAGGEGRGRFPQCTAGAGEIV